MLSDCFKLSIVYILGLAIRLWLSASNFRNHIVERIEITTPLNSIVRVIEGNYWNELGIDPYSSDILHESPAHMKLYNTLFKLCGDYMPYLFIAVDLVTAHLCYLFAKRYMLHVFIEQTLNTNEYVKDAKNQLLRGKDFTTPPLYMAAIYLLNPYTIFNCTAQSTTAFANLLLGILFYSFVHANLILGAVALAILTLQSFYPVVLIAPLFLAIRKYGNSKLKADVAVLLFIALFASLLYYSKYLTGNWDFIADTFGFILQVNDQQPNVGVFWYFFMEMFEHFRLLFIFSYQINVTILYFIPLTIKFRKDPVLLATCFVTLTAIFKSYPSLGDFAFSLALLPCWKHLYNCMQQIFISCATVFVTTALAPILWDLWIYWGTANANFFFGATLAFITAHIFLLTDISFAYTKREYLLKYGNGRKINGLDAKLVLE